MRAVIEAGYTPVILDNLHNSKVSVLERINTLTGKTPLFYEGDIRDRAILDKIFQRTPDSFGDSFRQAGKPWANPSPNRWRITTITSQVRCVLLEAMRDAGVKNLIFSSSATVYGDQPKTPYVEDFPTGNPSSPYGRSKLMVEQILEDVQRAEPEWSMTLLRYFNPVGAHPSGLMGEDPQGVPNNLMPFIAQVAVGRRESVAVFGNDYPTKDGTGVRDYIHVVDLADGHLAAMKTLHNKSGVHIYNLGAGFGQSVLEVINAFSKACGKPVKYTFAPRRDGDLTGLLGRCRPKPKKNSTGKSAVRWKIWRMTPGCGSRETLKVIQTKAD